MYLCDALRREQHHFGGVFAKNVHPVSIHEETADNPKIGDILQIINWPALSKITKVLTDTID